MTLQTSRPDAPERGIEWALGPPGLGVLVLDARQTILDADAGACRLLGYQVGELEGHLVTHITHPDDLAAAAESVEILFTAPTPSVHLRKRYVRKDGSTLQAVVRLIAMRNVGGAAERALAILEEDANPLPASGILDGLERICHDGRLRLDGEGTVETALQLGIAMLGMEAAIVSRLDGDTGTVLYAAGPGPLRVGRKAPVATTLWSAPVQAQGVALVPDTAAVGLPAAHLGAPVRCYAGVLLHVDGRPAAVLDFVANQPRPVFNATDEEVLVILGRWVAAGLDRDWAVAAATAARRELEQRRQDHGLALQQVERLGADMALLLDSAAEGIYGIDAEGRITFANPAAARLLGHTVAGMIGQPHHALLHHSRADGSPYPRESCPVAISMRDGQAVRAERETMWRKDGSAIPVSLVSAPLRVGNRVTGAAIVFTDGSDRQRAEAERAELVRRLEHFLEALPHGVFILDADGMPHFANAAAQRLLGKSLSGRRPFADLVADYNVVREGTEVPYPIEDLPISRALAGERHSTCSDMEIRLPDRTMVLEVWAEPVRGPDGRLAFAIATFQDISERRADERRRALEGAVAQVLASSADVRDAVPRLLRALLRHLPFSTAAFWVVDRSAGVMRCADFVPEGQLQFEALEGVTRRNTPSRGSGLVGEAWRRGEPVAMMGEAFYRTFSRAREADAAGIRSALAVPVLAEGETVAVIELLGAKVTRPDAGLLSTLAAAGAQVGQFLRRAQVQADLRASVERIRELEDSRMRVLKTVAHDLGAPLVPIRLQLRTLQNSLGETSPSQAKALSVIERNLAQMQRLVEDVKDLARLQSGEIALQPEPLDLGELARQAVESFRAEAEVKGVRLADRLGPAMVEADAQRMTQVLFNLLSNALKFTPSGGTVTVEATCDDERAHLRVHDTGRGLSRDDVARLFKAFSQVHDRSTVPERGSGLGLFICKGLVERHGGSIEVSSPGPGLGSTFTVTLPRLP